MSHVSQCHRLTAHQQHHDNNCKTHIIVNVSCCRTVSLTQMWSHDSAPDPLKIIHVSQGKEKHRSGPASWQVGQLSGIETKDNVPVSHICAFTVFPSTLIDLVANSTPMVDLDSRLNSLRVKRESTTCHCRMSYTTGPQLFMTRTITKETWSRVNTLFTVSSRYRTTYDLPTPESPMRTTYGYGQLTPSHWHARLTLKR